MTSGAVRTIYENLASLRIYRQTDAAKGQGLCWMDLFKDPVDRKLRWPPITALNAMNRRNRLSELSSDLFRVTEVAPGIVHIELWDEDDPRPGEPQTAQDILRLPEMTLVG